MFSMNWLRKVISVCCSFLQVCAKAVFAVVLGFFWRTSGAVQGGLSGAVGAAAHSGGGGRRGKRRQYTQEVKGYDSDAAEHFSGDSLASGAHSQPSSHPGFVSCTRRRPANKPSETTVKKCRGHSSEEYATSDNDSIFSDDSLTHSSERHETSSQVSELRASVEQLASSLQGSDVTDTEVDQHRKDAGMEGDDPKPNVHVLVSFFESQMKQQQTDDSSGEQTPRERVSYASPRTRTGGEEDDSEDGQIVGGRRSVVAKAPVSVLHAGEDADSDESSEDEVEAGPDVDKVREDSSCHARARQSKNVSMTPTNTWHSSPSTLEDREAASAEQLPDSASKRRKSKLDSRYVSAEKRQRQDKLTSLHSKYGLMD